MEKYRQVLKYLSTRIGDKYVEEVRVRPDNALFEGQILQEELSGENNYVIGTVDQDIGLAKIREEKFSYPEEASSRFAMSEDVLTHVDPFISEERAIVCIRSSIKQFSLSANLKAQWNKLEEKKGEIWQAPKLYLSHIVVDV